ncbi:hypothetical protein QBC44DRAFT_138933 [Cladorrhinum sp. PSN332]|nr:hypothetical protein QBC44DRAFT_138933 [Cladorrhinum sp. PSN332]
MDWRRLTFASRGPSQFRRPCRTNASIPVTILSSQKPKPLMPSLRKRTGLRHKDPHRMMMLMMALVGAVPLQTLQMSLLHMFRRAAADELRNESSFLPALSIVVHHVPRHLLQSATSCDTSRVCIASSSSPAHTAGRSSELATQTLDETTTFSDISPITAKPCRTTPHSALLWPKLRLACPQYSSAAINLVKREHLLKTCNFVPLLQRSATRGLNRSGLRPQALP